MELYIYNVYINKSVLEVTQTFPVDPFGLVYHAPPILELAKFLAGGQQEQKGWRRRRRRGTVVSASGVWKRWISWSVVDPSPMNYHAGLGYCFINIDILVLMFCWPHRC